MKGAETCTGLFQTDFSTLNVERYLIQIVKYLNGLENFLCSPTLLRRIYVWLELRTKNRPMLHCCILKPTIQSSLSLILTLHDP